MNIIFGGAEIPSNRTLLARCGVTHVAVSYWGLRKRGLPKTKEYLLAERFPEDVTIYVESGGPQVDAAGLTLGELQEYAADYEHFLSINESRIAGATELDSKALGHRFVLDQRRTFWDDFGEDRFWPVWSHEEGFAGLLALSQQYPHVALSGASVEADSTLSSRTRTLIQQYQTAFHGLGLAKPDELRQIPFESVTTLAWLSPMRRGETVVWDGTRLVRYPKKMKDQARLRLAAICQRAGLDHDLILADDNTEITRLAVWSYQQLEQRMDRKDNPFTVIDGEGGLLADNKDILDDPGSAERGTAAPDNSVVERGNLQPRHPDEMIALPVFGYQMKTVVETDENGREVLRDVPVVQSQSSTLRQCNTCFVASNCPAFKPNNTCAFNLPIEVKTKDQLRGLLNAIIEMQGARVAFARFSEELNGGYPDPNVSQEIDRLFKLVKSLKELEDNREFVRMTVERQGSGGVLSALFGDRAQALAELPQGGLDANSTNKVLDQGLNG